MRSLASLIRFVSQAIGHAQPPSRVDRERQNPFRPVVEMGEAVRVRIIASKPRPSQEGTKHLIGKIFTAKRDRDEPKRVKIKEGNGDQSILNPGEWEEVK